MTPDLLTYLMGPLGLLVGCIVALLAGRAGTWYWGREVRERLAEKDKQIADLTLAVDRWQGLHVDLLQSYQRQAVASTTLATAALGKTS